MNRPYNEACRRTTRAAFAALVVVGRSCYKRQLSVMDTTKLEQWIDTLLSLGKGDGDRATKAQRAVDIIRKLGSYRWAGLYDVLPSEIAVIAWSGPQAPTHPRFPVDKGLNGACASSRKPVIVQDVAGDPRYLTTIGLAVR